MVLVRTLLMATLGRIALYLLALCIQLLNGLPYLKVETDAREQVRAKVSKVPAQWELSLGRVTGWNQNHGHLLPILL